MRLTASLMFGVIYADTALPIYLIRVSQLKDQGNDVIHIERC